MVIISKSKYVPQVPFWGFRGGGRHGGLVVSALYSHGASLHPGVWVGTNCQRNLTKCWGVTCNGLTSCPGGEAILLVASCYGNCDKIRWSWATRPVRLNLFQTFGAWGYFFKQIPNHPASCNVLWILNIVMIFFSCLPEKWNTERGSIEQLLQQFLENVHKMTSHQDKWVNKLKLISNKINFMNHKLKSDFLFCVLCCHRGKWLWSLRKSFVLCFCLLF